MGRALFVRQDSGQTVVLVALMFTVLMGFAALSIDVGRFYSERRFLQTAVDAAALACAYKYAQGGILADAWQAANNVLQQRNLQGNPLGLAPGPGGVEYAALGSEVYDPTVAPQNLVSGILPTNNNGIGCRVAITVQVPTFLIKIVSPTLNTIPMTTRGYAKSKTGFLPSVVHRYANPPGPGLSDAANQFHDHTMAQGSDWNCTTTNTAGCTPASVAVPGRDFVIFGQAAKATNDNSFRGYIGLDIRDFTNSVGGVLIHEQVNGIAYNEVPATVNVQTLKDFEANWILEGYPGPDICVVELPNFKPCAQIAVINGSSSGQFVDDYESRFDVGDKLLLQLYDGLVKTVPDFNISSGTLTLPMDGSATSTVQYTYSFEFEESGATVLTTLIPDDGTDMTDDGGGTPNNPFIGG
ncbi:MAG: pilus assembly protein TadG-related protein, partial [Candidatus Limnocylindria bacterium]